MIRRPFRWEQITPTRPHFEHVTVDSVDCPVDKCPFISQPAGTAV
jgi:hypothetical protein